MSVPEVARRLVPERLKAAAGIDRVVCASALAIALLATIAAFHWMRLQPYPLWWDEANYYNQVVDDRAAFLRGGPLALAKSLVFADNCRPPAYRAIVAPVGGATLPSLALLRGISLVVTMAAMAVLFRVCRAVAGLSSSLFAVALVFSIPELLSSGAWFGTEYPLFLAVAMLLFSLLRNVRVGVAAAVALGLLAKSSFLVIGGPAILVALITARNRRDAGNLLVASTCGVLIAAGYWYWDPGAALQFAQLGRTFERTAFEDPLSTAALVMKARVLVTALGASATLAATILAADALRRREKLSAPQCRSFLLAAATISPLMLMAFLSPVFSGRHLMPALIALAIPLAVLIDRARPALRAGLAVLALLQTGWMAVQPLRFLPRVEKTDWAQLKSLVPGQAPRISLMGGWPSSSPPEIRYGWTQQGLDASTIWLWRAEQRSIDWPAIMRDALGSDAVLVVPPSALTAHRLSRYDNLDNLHNAELIRRLTMTGAFRDPVMFRVGTWQRVDLLVYVRESRIE